VIKVEPPGGDYTRGMHGEFEAANRNKRSLVLDLRQPAAVAIARSLAAISDAVVETYQPGVAGRLGIGVRELRRRRPDLVYCSLTNFGQTGRRRADAGHDLEFLAGAGALAPSRWADAGPGRSPIAVVDVAAGLYAAIAIEAALLGRARDGRGRRLDVALADTALAAASFRPTLFETGAARTHLSPLNDVFSARDGRMLALTVIGEPSWQRLRDALADLEPALLDSHFQTEAGRAAAGDELHALLRKLFASQPRSRWVALLRAARVAAEPVLTGSEAVRRPAATRSGLVDAGTVAARVRFPVAIDGHYPNVRRRPPRLGEHTREVLADLGLDEQAISALLEAGAAAEG
jgi:crotonobetainyl-CoA:carnitine CoA-transferase CaiB-like acyl-CoA transferase